MINFKKLSSITLLLALITTGCGSKVETTNTQDIAPVEAIEEVSQTDIANEEIEEIEDIEDAELVVEPDVTHEDLREFNDDPVVYAKEINPNFDFTRVEDKAYTLDDILAAYPEDTYEAIYSNKSASGKMSYTVSEGTVRKLTVYSNNIKRAFVTWVTNEGIFEMLVSEDGTEEYNRFDKNHVSILDEVGPKHTFDVLFSDVVSVEFKKVVDIHSDLQYDVVSCTLNSGLVFDVDINQQTGYIEEIISDNTSVFFYYESDLTIQNSIVDSSITSSEDVEEKLANDLESVKHYYE